MIEAAAHTSSPPGNEAPPSRMIWWLPRLAFLLFALAVVALLWFAEKNESEKQRATLISDLLWLEQNLHFQLTHNEELLGRFPPQRMGYPEAFEAHARALIASSTGVYRIFWVDDADQPRHALPTVESNTTAGTTPGNTPSPSLLRLAHSLGRPVYGPTDPSGQDDWEFEVHVPIFTGGRKAGTAVGIYSIRRLLEHSVPWWLTERYRIGISDQGNQMLALRSKVDAVMPGSEYEIPFDPPGHGLVLNAAPYQSPTALIDRLLAVALVVLAILVLTSLWALRRHVQKRLVAEAALQTEAAFRKAMEDSVHTGLRARSLEGRITYVNPAFCRMVGWSATELVGHSPPMPYWAEEYFDETRAMNARVLAGDAPDEGFEIRFRRRNGEIFDALIHEAPLIDGEGRHTGWMGSVVDITERKRIADLSRQQEERLQANARLITMGEMASSLAHELSQPLAAISGYAAGCRNLIAIGTTCEVIDDALAKCQQQAQRAGRIIRRIYEFAGRHETRVEPCDLETLLSDLFALIEPDMRRRKVQIERNIDTDLPIIHVDHILLGQAVLNLMKNGIEAMSEVDEKARILRVGVRCLERQIEISITDHGCGISPEAGQHLFEPFYTTKSEGLGVGLNICRSVVEAHHGRLVHEENSGGGCIFRIFLPVDTA